MNYVTIGDLEPRPYDDELHADRRPLSEPLGAEHVAITRYVLEPGERFSGSVHAHFDQEEVFVVLEGEATFEASPNDDDRDGRPTEITVGENEAIRFAPGEFQSGRNDGEERVVALALGAPRDTEDIRISRIPVLDDRDVSCPDCEADHMRISRSDDADFECPDCAATLTLDVEQP
ncbi:cupin domain-containing protein [Natronorubrum sp. FCH18a]|uniref:cupin domain-containing protein n=1 Tax=Natronorubrum sp. FCH18a TaxID=3447018 RepID=UPI003F51A6E8